MRFSAVFEEWVAINHKSLTIRRFVQAWITPAFRFFPFFCKRFFRFAFVLSITLDPVVLRSFESSSHFNISKSLGVFIDIPLRVKAGRSFSEQWKSSRDVPKPVSGTDVSQNSRRHFAEFVFVEKKFSSSFTGVHWYFLLALRGHFIREPAPEGSKLQHCPRETNLNRADRKFRAAINSTMKLLEPGWSKQHTAVYFHIQMSCYFAACWFIMLPKSY